MNPYSDFGVKARGVMLKKRISMASIAKELGISAAYVGEILRGNRDGGKYREQIIKILEMEEEPANN